MTQIIVFNYCFVQCRDVFNVKIVNIIYIIETMRNSFTIYSQIQIIKYIA